MRLGRRLVRTLGGRRGISDWCASRGPIGFWLSVAATVLTPLQVSATATLHSATAGVALGGIATAMAAGAGMLALMHHPKGWLAVRLFAFVNAWLYGTLLVVSLVTRRPDDALWYVMALAAATIVCVAVFEYFRQAHIERLFPGPPVPARRR